MTAQIMDTIYVDGKKYEMASEPFEQYLENMGNSTEFSAPNTACWRGYESTWKIKDNKLYLTKFKGHISTPETNWYEIDMNYFFPNQEIVFAQWFTGEIRIPIGEMLQYVHMGYESVYEKELLINIKNGIVIGRIETSNV